jgi:hypothetical protein
VSVIILIIGFIGLALGVYLTGFENGLTHWFGVGLVAFEAFALGRLTSRSAP